jgi:hypothetical protein
MADLEEPRPDIEQLLSVIVVQNQRMYDVLLVLLANQNREAYTNIIQVHEAMDNLGPKPFRTDDD